MKNKIVFTGGGSAGHVTPNIALIDYFQDKEWEVAYIGSYTGIEKEIIASLDIPYYGIATGKLRRYFSWQNFIDPFRVLQGMWQAFRYLRTIKPHVLFSKGGFVSFPVVFAAWLNRIPVVVHESDFSPGLANRLSFPFSKKICVTFSEAVDRFKDKQKVVATGTPIRQTLFKGDAASGKQICHFDDDKKIILVMAGGSGSVKINHVIRDALPPLLKNFNVIHCCGKGRVKKEYANKKGYIQFDYVSDELADLMACADLVISRAGANSLYELLALRKPHILIPLSKTASRGDQIDNAQYFEERGLSQVISDEAFDVTSLMEAVTQMEKNLPQIQAKLKEYPLPNSTEVIYSLVSSLSA